MAFSLGDQFQDCCDHIRLVNVSFIYDGDFPAPTFCLIVMRSRLFILEIFAYQLHIETRATR